MEMELQMKATQLIQLSAVGHPRTSAPGKQARYTLASLFLTLMQLFTSMLKQVCVIYN